jgi:uncharacterized protein (DUF849 family)
MNKVDITLRLPEELVNRAEAAGVLTEERVTALLEMEIKRQAHAERFAQTVKQLRELEPPLTEEDIEAEIEAYRAAKSNGGKPRDT